MQVCAGLFLAAGFYLEERLYLRQLSWWCHHAPPNVEFRPLGRLLSAKSLSVFLMFPHVFHLFYSSAVGFGFALAIGHDWTLRAFSLVFIKNNSLCSENSLVSITKGHKCIASTNGLSEFKDERKGCMWGGRCAGGLMRCPACRSSAQLWSPHGFAGNRAVELDPWSSIRRVHLCVAVRPHCWG